MVHLKTKIMKKIFALAFIAAAFTACNDADTDTTSVDTDTTTTTTTTTRSYTAAEGDVSYRNENWWYIKMATGWSLIKM